MRFSSVPLTGLLALMMTSLALGQWPSGGSADPPPSPSWAATAARGQRDGSLPRTSYWDYQLAADDGSLLGQPGNRFEPLPSPSDQQQQEPGREIIIGQGVSDPTLGPPPSVPSYGQLPLGGDCLTGDCGPQVYGGSGFGRLGIAPVMPRRWFFGAGGLIFDRSSEDEVALAFDDTQPAVSILNYNDAQFDVAGGVEARVGRYLSNLWAVEAIYWGIFPRDLEQTVRTSNFPGNLDSTFSFTGLDYDNGGGNAPAGDFFSDSQMFRIHRQFEYHNIELNLLRNACPGPSCSRSHFVWLAGPRYLRIDESFCLASDFTSEAFGDDPDNELFYNVELENHLIGMQLGGIWDHCVTDRISLRVASKAGIFGNRMRHRQFLWGGTGFATVNTGPDTGENFNVESRNNDVSFLGELFGGATYRVGYRWRAFGGYRAVFASSVATPANQIPHRFSDLNEVSTINTDGSLVLHGVVVGGEYNW